MQYWNKWLILQYLDLHFALDPHFLLRNCYRVQFRSVGLFERLAFLKCKVELCQFLSELSKLQWFWTESAFKKAPKFGFVTADKSLNKRKKLLYIKLYLWKLPNGDFLESKAGITLGVLQATGHFLLWKIRYLTSNLRIHDNDNTTVVYRGLVPDCVCPRLCCLNW